MSKKLFIIFLFAVIVSSSIKLEEYPQYEEETPEVVFHQIQPSDQINHSSVSKLMFITPWNQEGKKLTIKYAHKIKYVSPCWYELVPKNGIITFQNDQLVDLQYIQQIKTANPDIKILPRLYVNNFQVFREIGTKQDVMLQVSKLIFDTFEKNGFDGIVWDSPYNLFIADQQVGPLNNLIVEFVNRIKSGFKFLKGKEFLLFFNMANPARKKLDNNLYRKLHIDGLLIQNYDSPLHFLQMLKESTKWFNSVKPDAKQVFMMLPFFSYKNGQGMSTIDVKRELENDGIFDQGFEKGMCKFVSEKKNNYLVPCNKYFSEVYRMLEKTNLSAGFWQGGNGLENYYLFM